MSEVSGMRTLRNASSHLAVVRAALELADALKTARPELHPQVEALQGIIARAQVRLDELERQTQNAASLAWRDGRPPPSTHAGNGGVSHRSRSRVSGAPRLKASREIETLTRCESETFSAVRRETRGSGAS